ncbi:sulfate ABC transporter ATP-binding protein [Acinetobacter faecalis]|uniref:sulfate/molybdate ABC transporter ATP-binding protein n=1 Tax=Acinetobacter faecalis TaxID=2665161 RepID=UPI001B768022|nr:sulfate ABC transporter ATP-binding protein [Acinetobacter faecalis]MBP7783292.1 sulfate ABC transporter ATP-binding protein [Acinetobacter sp.]MDY6482053.1 sulfate ABC transporter ATP-binding protein [Acinetobacter faecalis]
MSIQVKNIEKHFGAFHALNNISLDFPDGQLVALLGPSGCGKTTLLRIIAGLESADGGQVILEGEDATNVHVREREVGFVFQHYALFRHMTVFDNIAFGLRVRPRATRPSEAEIKKRVTRLLDLVQLGFLADRYPAQLSGGQRQRIALARALAVEPRVLLLDEPFGALDAKVRKELRRWLRTLHDELHITSIFVTHDQEEALEVADQIIVMNKGNVEQIGSPREVYEKPATPFVFDFLGQANRFEGHNQNGVIQIGEDRIQLDSLNKAPEGSVIAFARPDELHIHAQPQDNAIQAIFIREVWIAGKVIAELNDRQGNLIEITLTPDEAKLHQFRPNQTVWLSATALHLFENQVA